MDRVEQKDLCRYRRQRGAVVIASYERTFHARALASRQAALQALIGDLLHASDLYGLSFVEALGRAAVEKRSEVLGELEDAFSRSSPEPPEAAPQL